MFEQVQKVIAEQLNIDPANVKPESKLVEDLEADSLDVVELVTELEMSYQIDAFKSVSGCRPAAL